MVSVGCRTNRIGWLAGTFIVPGTRFLSRFRGFYLERSK